MKNVTEAVGSGVNSSFLAVIPRLGGVETPQSAPTPVLVSWSVDTPARRPVVVPVLQNVKNRFLSPLSLELSVHVHIFLFFYAMLLEL